jgi:hypothetical protein
MNEINATQLVIRKFLYAIRNYRKEDSEAGRWLDWLGDTLQYQDLMENMEPFGAEMLAEAKAFSLKKRLGGQLKAAKGSLIKEGNSNPTQEEIEKRRMEMYGEDEDITAAVHHREAWDVSTTGCDHSQEAPTRKAGDESSDARKGAALKSATSCNQLTADGDISEDSQDVTDGSNSGKLESGTSANHYDKEATPTSTNGPRQAEAPQGQRAGENSVRRVEKVSTSPVRSSGPAKHQHGEFGNVMLTDDEFAKLCEKCPEADALITDAKAIGTALTA